MKIFIKNTKISMANMAVGIPYLAPTTLRNVLEKRGNEGLNKEENKTSKIGYYSGMSFGTNLGIVFDVAQTQFYINSAAEGKPYWIIPAVTNTASLVYELGIKPVVNKIKDRINYLEAELDKSTLQIDK